MTAVRERSVTEGTSSLKTDAIVTWVLVVVEYAIVISLLLIAATVLGRTVVGFLRNWASFPESVFTSLDGILLVIILLDIVHTVFRSMRSSEFPVRPFLFIGILVGVREILSASARLTLSQHLKTSSFHDTIITLGIGVGVVLVLLIGLFILSLSERCERQ